MSPGPHTRRDALKLLGPRAAACGGGWPAPAATSRSADAAPRPRGLNYFVLDDVRLGDGPFLDAQKLDAAYLLKLEPDRLLHNFRVNAGLAPKAAVYGGW